MDMYENRDEGCFADIRLVDFCNRFCLSNRINEPTRVTKTSKILIDVLLTSHAECYGASGSLHLGLSDHALGDTKQKKLTPLDRGPPLHVNRVLGKRASRSTRFP